MLRVTTATAQVTSYLIKLEKNRKLTGKGIGKLVIPDIKTCTERVIFLGYAHLEADFITGTNIATSLPKDLYLIAKDVSIPSKWFFGDDINARVNNVKAQQKVFKIGKTYFKPVRTFNRQHCFPKSPGNQ